MQLVPAVEFSNRSWMLVGAVLLFAGGVLVGQHVTEHRQLAARVDQVERAVTRLSEPPPTPPAMIWAASVRDLSTQYASDNWSAAQALGAPDVFPAHGDQVKAWASLTADDRLEFLEVALARPSVLSAVEVYETYNPGAVSEIELIGVSGKRVVVHRQPAAASGQGAQRKRVDFACTAEPIAAIRVTVDSQRVAGWNEIDAIGGQPCAAP